MNIAELIGNVVIVVAFLILIGKVVDGIDHWFQMRRLDRILRECGKEPPREQT
jgi:hypothetical protein